MYISFGKLRPTRVAVAHYVRHDILGLPLAVTAGRLISVQLYGISSWDPLALTVAANSLAIFGFVAVIIPTGRSRVYFADECIGDGVRLVLEHCTHQDLNLCQIRLHCRVAHAKDAIDPPRQSRLSLEPYAFNPKVKPASNNRAKCTAVPKFGERAAIQAIELFAENAAPTLNRRSCVEYPIQSRTGAHK